MNSRLLAVHRLRLFDVLVLELIAESADGSARMCDMAEALAMMPSRLSQQIDRLESRRLVRRQPDPEDRRSVLAVITPAGRARLRPALTTYAREIRKHYLNQLSRQQMIALGDSCRPIGAPHSGA